MSPLTWALVGTVLILSAGVLLAALLWRAFRAGLAVPTALEEADQRVATATGSASNPSRAQPRA